MKVSVLDESAVVSALNDALSEWHYDGDTISRVYETAGWKASLLLTQAIGHLAELAWHHPDILVSFNSVTVSLVDHEAGGVSLKDIELATRIEAFACWRPSNEQDSVLSGTPPDDAAAAYLP